MFALLLPLLAQAQAPAPATVPVRRIPAQEANQGVAADDGSVYAVGNSDIGKYDRATGRRIGAWHGDKAVFKHLNSCTVVARALVCAASNYPGVPMASSVHWIDTRTMTLKRSRALGGDIGSLTWAVPARGGWWACFANYDGRGGVAGRDHRATMLVRYDRAWREQGRWRFPDAVLERMAPRSASGGAVGDDGLLYVSGHDAPEVYVLRVPARGGVLELVTTIAMPTGGQAIGWDRREPRLLWSIDRDARALVASRVPVVR